MEERYITTVDLGSSKIALCVAKINEEHAETVYYRETPSDGIRYGSIFNPQKAAAALNCALKSAEDELGIKILQVVAGLPGDKVEQISANAKIKRTDASSCIEQTEIDLLKSNAIGSYPLRDPEHQDIYGAVAQSFNADDIIGVPEEDIIGMTSENLEGNFKIFTGPKKAISNIDVMLGKAGVTAAEKYFLPLSTANAVLTQGEKENGVALVEIGAGLTSLTIFQNGLLRHYSSIPFGGRSITADIRYEYGLRDHLAENIKLAFGACMPERLQSMSEKIIQINNDEDGSCQQIPVRELSMLVDARMREIFEAVLYNIEESSYADKLRNGIVLTGGGANLTNCQLLLKEMSGYNVRMGFPRCKTITTMGCAGTGETSAAASIGMVMKARENVHLNCTVEITEKAADADISTCTPEPNSPEKVEDTIKTEEPTITAIWQEVPAAPKPKPHRSRGLFSNVGRIGKVINETVDGTLGKLFDDMQ